jgi:hypothetical protein
MNTVKNIVLGYPKNILSWAGSYSEIVNKTGYTTFGKIGRFFVWIDIGANVAFFGGDPRVTISLHAQRSGGWAMGVVRYVANAVFHKDGVMERPWGKGTEDDRSLPWQGKIALIGGWLCLGAFAFL